MHSVTVVRTQIDLPAAGDEGQGPNASPAGRIQGCRDRNEGYNHQNEACNHRIEETKVATVGVVARNHPIRGTNAARPGADIWPRGRLPQAHAAVSDNNAATALPWIAPGARRSIDCSPASTSVFVTFKKTFPTGVPIELRVEIAAAAAPTVGHVTITASPGGSCTDAELEPLDASTSVARCTITWATACTRELVADYVGATDGTQVWQSSRSAPVLLEVTGATPCTDEVLFDSSFE